MHDLRLSLQSPQSLHEEVMGKSLQGCDSHKAGQLPITCYLRKGHTESNQSHYLLGTQNLTS